MTKDPDYWLTTTVTDLHARDHIMRHIATLFGIDPAERAANNILWRSELDPPTGGQRLLIQSALPPLDSEQVQTKPVHGWFDRLRKGARIEYRIHMAPYISSPKNGHQGKTILGNQKSYARWTGKQAPAAGLALDLDQITMHRKKPAQISRRTGTGLLHLPIDQFDGEAIIEQPEYLHEAVRKGIGHSKWYGFGLLSLRVIHVE